ncbi:hypothetical protein E0L36_23435 [Streptomyces sp. AJS327]|uniref:hypothetical protein n=1 Tax=Streptomyces sp. AJS327 TaxID=2545265 RepID=UPI0015E0480F|nr:hypothetical protein [Streptomyces sp. AJS327]MBA0053708.1 hypothetical protein [Streptomyces sp. AJS327]
MRSTGTAGGGSRRALVAGAVVCAVVVSGCGGQDSGPKGSSESDEGDVTVAATAKKLQRASMLRWKGSWRAGEPGEPKTRISVDVRALPAGDVVGTVTSKGRTTTVAHVPDNITLVRTDRTTGGDGKGAEGNTKADKGRWREVRERSGPSDRLGEGEGQIAGLDLTWFPPRELAEKLREYRPARSSAPGGTSTEWSTESSTRRSTEWTPSGTVPKNLPRPSGVPRDALGFHAKPRSGHGYEGVYWVEPDRPRRLLGYTGRDAEMKGPFGSLRGGPEPPRMTVRAEGKAAAKRAYRELRSIVDGLGKTISVNVPLSNDLARTSHGEAVCGPRCHSLTVPVTVRNNLPDARLRPRVRVTVRGGELGTPRDALPVLGSCEVRFRELRPEAEAEGGCTITGAELRKVADRAERNGGSFASAGIGLRFSTSPHGVVRDASEKKALAKVLHHHEKDTLG